jgi:hypothetical protein
MILSLIWLILVLDLLGDAPLDSISEGTGKESYQDFHAELWRTQKAYMLMQAVSDSA